MSVTMVQVARECGVSRATVSLAFNDKGHMLHPDTLQRVMQTAEALGYRPHASAVAMRSGRHNCLGVLFSPRMYMPLELLHGLDEAMSRHNIHGSIVTLPHESPDDPRQVPKVLRTLMADGLLVNFMHSVVPPRMDRIIGDAGMPTVWVNSVRDDHSCVYPDEEGAGREVVSRLVDLGHRRIAYLSVGQKSDGKHYSCEDRPRGVVNAAREAGVQVEVIHEGLDKRIPGRSEAARALLGRSDRPTAVVCYGLRTVAAGHLAAVELGLSVPRDVSFVTFHDRAEDPTGLLYATALLPWGAVASHAVELLLDHIELKDPSHMQHVAVPYTEFDAGETLAAAPV